MKTDFALDAAQFQSLVSSERMNIQRKHASALETTILAPGFLAGNTLPLKWVDLSGSIKRRLLLFMFSHKPTNLRNDLLDRMLCEELPFIMKKINHCYRMAVSLASGKDLWQSGLLSEHIVAQSDDLFESMNPLRSFVRKGLLTTGPQYWVPLKTFLQEFNDFNSANGNTKQAWNTDLYDSVFKGENIAVRQARYHWDDQPSVTGQIIVGACFQTMIDKMSVLEGIENPVIFEMTEVVQNVFI